MDFFTRSTFLGATAYRAEGQHFRFLLPSRLSFKKSFFFCMNPLCDSTYMDFVSTFLAVRFQNRPINKIRHNEEPTNQRPIIGKYDIFDVIFQRCAMKNYGAAIVN